MPRPTHPAITRRTALAGAAAAGLAGLVPATSAASTRSAADDDADLIMIIRHGEKPPKSGGAPYGITAGGTRDSNALTTEGWARAGALVGLFAPRRGSVPAGLACPRAVFASRPDHGSNLRESETVSYVAGALGVPVQTPFLVGQEAQLAARLRRLRGPILIAWEHKALPRIPAHLGSVHPSVPSKWPSDRFDMVWVLRRSGAGGYSFTQVPELLLPGDSATPIH